MKMLIKLSIIHRLLYVSKQIISHFVLVHRICFSRKDSASLCYK